MNQYKEIPRIIQWIEMLKEILPHNDKTTLLKHLQEIKNLHKDYLKTIAIPQNNNDAPSTQKNDSGKKLVVKMKNPTMYHIANNEGNTICLMFNSKTVQRRKYMNVSERTKDLPLCKICLSGNPYKKQKKG